MAALAALAGLAAACDGGAATPPGVDSSSSGRGGAPAGSGGAGGGALDGGTPPTDEQALEILRRPSFAPTDPGLFARLYYPAGPEERPAAGPALDEAGARQLLERTLRARPGLAADKVDATLALWDDVRLRVPLAEPTLRAALLLLRGTVGDAAIDTVLGGAFAAVRFAPLPPFFPNTTAWVERAADGLTIFLAEAARLEDPRALASILAHETLHSDADVHGKEEAICSALEALVHGQMMVETPAIARSGGQVARWSNTRLLERLNGRDEQGRLRIVYSAGYTLPRSQAGYGFMVEYYEPFTRNTAGNAQLAAMVAAATGAASATPGPVGFDDATIERLDAGQTALRPAELVALAAALALDTNPAPDVAAAARPAPAASPVVTLPDPASPAEQQALALLRGPPFAPRNPALFDRAAYPAGPPDPFAAGPGLDAAGARALVRDTLVRRFGASDPRAAIWLAAFDGGTLARAIPEPALRAALLVLAGTAGQPVIDAFAGGAFTGLGFAAEAPDLPFSWVVPPAPGVRPAIGLNASIRHEDPRLLAPWIVEAALHEDARKTPKELLVGRALVPLVYGQFLLETPELAKGGSGLARLLNRTLLGRLNSRNVQGRLTLLSGIGLIYPGTRATQRAYLADFIPYGPNTPGNRTLWELVVAATGTDRGFEGDFSVATVQLLDQRQALWSAQQIVTLARTLELEVP